NIIYECGDFMKDGLKCGFVYAGAVIGAGFASGKELWQFFGRFGSAGIAGLLFSFLLYFFLGLAVFKAVSEEEKNALSLTGGVINKLNLLFMFALLVSMTAAAGSLSSLILGLPPILGSLIFTFVIYLCSLGGKTAFVGINSLLTPVMTAFGVFLGLYICPLGTDLPKTYIPAVPKSLFSALIYVSYNILTLYAIMLPLKNKLKTPVSRFTAALTGSLIMFILGVCLFSPIVIYCNILEKSPLPLLSVIKYLKLDLLSSLCALLLFSAVFTTAIGNFFGLAESPSVRVSKALILSAAFFCSLIGFSNIISTIYPIFGILGLLNIAFLLYTNYNKDE
ncbi:MAG: hypothetical protein LUC92_04130, partial [Clostridiales bacterium]|nr:hypothetical protein [Clostridiales bacterium]